MTKLAYQVTHVDTTFYSGIRNEMTVNRLDEMSKIAKDIEMPLLLGMYMNESHYIKTLKLMLGSTEETRHRGAFILRKILPMLSEKNTLLDVGTGNGQVMSWIGNHFKHVTAVDTNKEEIEALNSNKKQLKKNIQLNKIHGSILNHPLPPNFYDLTLLCHVLYYIPQEQWINAIDVAHNTTKDNGIILIVLSGDSLGKGKLIKQYNKTSIDIDFLVEQCVDRFGEGFVEVFSSEEMITTNDLNAMLHIAGFFLRDGSTATEKESLIDYINTHCKKSDNLFCMSTEQKFIVIRKRDKQDVVNL